MQALDSDLCEMIRIVAGLDAAVVVCAHNTGKKRYGVNRC